MLENIYQTNTNSTSELKIILRQHFDHCQVLSTVTWRPPPLITLSIQLCAQQDDDWLMVMMQCVSQSVSVNKDLYFHLVKIALYDMWQKR